MGLSENSVPLNPMVNDHYPVFKWLFHWEYTLFSDKPIYDNVLNFMLFFLCIILDVGHHFGNSYASLNAVNLVIWGIYPLVN